MSKYKPLTVYLHGQKPQVSIPMTFEEIERIIGTKLPQSASKHRAWWSNNPTNNVMTDAWLKAGYKTRNVDMEDRKLVFEKSDQAESPPEIDDKESAPGKIFNKADPDFFLYISGSLKGTVTISPGVDLTSPVGEQWDVTG